MKQHLNIWIKTTQVKNNLLDIDILFQPENKKLTKSK